MIKLVLFDFDGVLVNSNEAWVDVQNRLAKDIGVERKISYDSLKPMYGKPYMDVLRGLHPEARQDSDVLTTMYNNMMEIASSDDFLDSFSTIAGIEDSLIRLKKKFKLAVASGNNKKVLHRFIEKFGLNGYFDFVVSADEVENGKPHPDMLNKALEHFGLEPHECVYVGDAVSDIQAAKKAKMYSIAVLSGALSREEATEMQPDFIVEDATKVQAVLECMS
ncbi:MAG: HAD family hydrolase [Candidatus Aenigmarchaeota archaeon]|nr:HAD family hydrolase [Candidatus Aenigmarchaeota archaeon]